MIFKARTDNVWFEIIEIKKLDSDSYQAIFTTDNIYRVFLPKAKKGQYSFIPLDYEVYKTTGTKAEIEKLTKHDKNFKS